VIVALARSRGLSGEDAVEAAQATLASFAEEYANGKYDRARGRLSSWIIGIAEHRIAALHRERSRRRAMLGETAVAQRCDDGTTVKDWNEAMHTAALERALGSLHSESRMDRRTILAFELSALRGVPAEQVSEQCGMTVAEVYVAKNRVIRKLRDLVQAYLREMQDE